MYAIDTQAGALLRSKLLDGIPGVLHGFGVRGRKTEEYLSALGISDCFLAKTNQIHGNRVHYLARRRGGVVLEGDAFITDRPGIVCFVRSADCVPVLIADKSGLGVAAVHAGWRGTAQDAVGEALRAMNFTFGTNAADCVVAIGPRICSGCYEVGEEVVGALDALKIGDSWRVNGKNVDLGEANRVLAMRAGVSDQNIALFSNCTFCDDSFASFRRDKSEIERQVNFIVLSPQPQSPEF